MISLYVNAILCTLKHIIIHAKQLSGVNSEKWHRWVASRVWQYASACTKVHWRTRRSFSAPSLTSKYIAFAFVSFPVQSPRPTPTLVYETAGRFFVRHSVYGALRLEAFTKLWKVTISFVMSVCLSAWSKWVSTRWIFMKIGIWVFSNIFRGNTSFIKSWED